MKLKGKSAFWLGIFLVLALIVTLVLVDYSLDGPVSRLLKGTDPNIEQLSRGLVLGFLYAVCFMSPISCRQFGVKLNTIEVILLCGASVLLLLVFFIYSQSLSDPAADRYFVASYTWATAIGCLSVILVLKAWRFVGKFVGKRHL